MDGILRGYVFAWYETGLEGVEWAFHDERFHGYDGLHVLEDGDWLCIHKEHDPAQAQWVGTISYNKYFEGERTPGGMLVHSLPKFVDATRWEHWFVGTCSASLVKRPKRPVVWRDFK
jgi:hypothetical protein